MLCQLRWWRSLQWWLLGSLLSRKSHLFSTFAPAIDNTGLHIGEVCVFTHISWWATIKHNHIFDRCRQHGIDLKSACLSFQQTQTTRPVCGKCLGDDLSGCKNTVPCLRWWMSNTPTTCHVLYIEVVTLASCCTNAAFADCTVSQVNCNSKSRGGERSSFCAHKDTHASEPNALLLLGTAGGGGFYTAVKVFMAFRWTKKWEWGAEGERDPPLSQFEQQADKTTEVAWWR